MHRQRPTSGATKERKLLKTKLTIILKTKRLHPAERRTEADRLPVHTPAVNIDNVLISLLIQKCSCAAK